MGKDIDIGLSRQGEVAVISIRGDVTPLTGELVEEAYRKATAEGTTRILLLFDGENYINSGGIAILIGIASESRKAGQTVRIAGLSDHFTKIFTMVGLAKYAAVFPSAEAALADF
jgi:anti-anti-sigma factor